MVPVGACQALTLALGNAAYLYLTVSFIQMLKAFTPVVVLAIGILFKLEKAEAKARPIARLILTHQDTRSIRIRSEHVLIQSELFTDYPQRHRNLRRDRAGFLGRAEFQHYWRPDHAGC